MAGNLDFFQNNVHSEAEIDLPPFFTVKDKPEAELLEWLKKTVEYRSKAHRDYFAVCRRNLIAYSGKYHDSGKRQSDSLEYRPQRRTSKYFVNHLYEMTENLVSRMTRVKPAVEVIPANDEYEDTNAAKAVQLLIKHLWYINDTDTMIQKLHRHKYIFGNAYLKIDWDENKGDLHPDYVAIRNSGKKVELPKGTPIRTGDVCYKIVIPWDLLEDPDKCWEESDLLIEQEVLHIEVLKHNHPEKAKLLKPVKDLTEFSLDKLKDVKKANHVVKYTAYYKHDEHCVEGKKIVFTNDTILEIDTLGHSHGDFPFSKLTDIDVPGTTLGVSRYQQALSVQNGHNNLSQTIMKNEFMMGAPKWMMPRGACKVDQLGNGRTIIQYQGVVPPQLIQMNPTSPTTFEFRDRIENDLGKVMGVHAVSRGEPPKGITAAVALQFLNEQETERSISDIAKHNNFVREVARKSVAVAGDHYQMDDGRMIRILGKENKFMAKYFDAANLHKDYDIRIQNSSALPQSQAARMERVLQTMQYGYELLTPERWVELLEFGSTEKMHTIITSAINSAESENEDMLEGLPVEEPKEWEDHITHLRVHYKKMQQRSFKEDIDDELTEEFIMHVKITEMLAHERAQKNPLFASKLAQLEQFPMFYDVPAPPSAEQQQMLGQQQAKAGEPVTAEIPAQDTAPLPGQTNNGGGQ